MRRKLLVLALILGMIGTVSALSYEDDFQDGSIDSSWDFNVNSCDSGCNFNNQETNGLLTAFKGGNTATQIAIILIPLGLIISFLVMPFTLAEKERERRARQNPNQPRGMKRRQRK